MSVALALLALLAQDKPEVTLKKSEARAAGKEWNLTLTFDHTLPDKTLLLVNPVWKRYAYHWQEKKLEFGDEIRIGHSVNPSPFEASRRTAKHQLELAAPGFYALEITIDPERQSLDAIKEALGSRRQVRFEISVGDPKPVLAGLRDDTDDCARLIREAQRFMDRIMDESATKENWDKNAEKLFEEIRKLRDRANQESNTSLLSGTYEVIWQILEDLLKVGAHIGHLKMQATNGQDQEDQDADLVHTENGGDTPVLADQGKKKLNLAQMKKNMRIADEIRMREYFAWIVRMHGHIIGRADAASINDDLEKTFQYETKEDFQTLTAYEIGAEKFAYADFFALFRDFLKDPELRAKIDEHLGVAHVRAVRR